MKKVFSVLIAVVVCVGLIQLGAVAVYATQPESEPQFGAPIVAEADICPDIINLKSGGKYVTVYLEMPAGYPVADIDLNSILLEETISAKAGIAVIGDHDNDGVQDLMVKFNRADLKGLVAAGETRLGIDFALLSGLPFRAMELVRIK
jgi:hypothetical protein